jgi:hypothetical protein
LTKEPEQVIETMRKLGNYATLGKLNASIDFSNWKTKTPEASVRRIVQENNEFFKIKPGLWALSEYKESVLTSLELTKNELETGAFPDEFTHSYYQGLIVEIGKMREGISTFVPVQDKNKKFLDRNLSSIVDTTQIPPFSYEAITRRAKTVDVIWFNEREMPYSFFEVEHSTDIQNSLLKYCDLQDFYSKFYIIANEARRRKYDEIISRLVFSEIKSRTKFINYEEIARIHTKTHELSKEIKL